MNIWLTSIGYGTSPDPAFLPTSVQFDYIKVWQKDYYLDNDGPAAYGYSETGTWFDLHPDRLDSELAHPVRAVPQRGQHRDLAAQPAAGGQLSGVRAQDRAQRQRHQRPLRQSPGTTTYLNGTTGTTGWVSLGTHALPAGTASSVKLTSSGNGCARADAVKFIRV